MGIKAFAAKIIAKQLVSSSKNWIEAPVEAQQKHLQKLIYQAKNTAFGEQNKFSQIKDYEDFKQALLVVDYEALRPFIDRMKAGEENILWPGKPIYWSKTSGTTSGAKFIPISKESIAHHMNAARNALLFYINRTQNSAFVDGKMIFLQGSPKLDKLNEVNVGRLSGIVAHHVPKYLQKNRMPSWETNCIDDWETKVNAVVEETIKEDMRLISGIPSWVQMYFERILERTGKQTIKEVFPNFSLFVYGGVNYEPYRPIFEELIGTRIDTIETYPASEGFIAYQDASESEGLLLNLDAGIFFEFIPLQKIHEESPPRIPLWEVELNTNYVIVMSTNAGLWSYMIGDTVRFTSIKPYRIKVTGRVKHFISAFGEHVIAEEAEAAMNYAMQKTGAIVAEFHLAPQVKPLDGLPFHEWFVEFTKKPDSESEFSKFLDLKLQEQNVYYKDLIQGSILKPAQVFNCRPNTFKDYMKSIGKLGGQNKIARLADNRKLAEGLVALQQS